MSGNYTLNITLVSYLNYNNWCSECSDDELGCCDDYDSTECTGSFRCDTYFEYCLLPVETAITRDRLQCNPVATSTVLTDDGPIDFTQSVVLGLSNPLQLSGTSNTWTVSKVANSGRIVIMTTFSNKKIIVGMGHF